MKEKLLKMKSKKSLYDIALDIGVSEASLYCYLNSYKKVGSKVLNKLESYLEGVKDESKSCK